MSGISVGNDVEPAERKVRGLTVIVVGCLADVFVGLTGLLGGRQDAGGT
ncbi:MAG: hypothetical protein JW936_03380 [Sedimentisphaerales bacterium]|nr:hypothetical protein [Sedimentisphaerales bacterium]